MNPQAVTPIEASSPYLFNARELARLAVYRAAVVARFYTDEVDQPEIRRQAPTLRHIEAARREPRAA
jgi:hypothetical protein